MTGDAILKLLPDKVRFVEGRMARLEDRLEVLEHRRTTWVPSHSWENLSGRQREVIYFLCTFALLVTYRRLAHAPAASL